MATHRERKAERTRTAIHKAAMRLFADRGFAATTVADIAAAADVSRATFFSYYVSKDDVVFGAFPTALEGLRGALREASTVNETVAAVRAWLEGLSGWLDDEDLPLQIRLVAEVPSVGARRLVLGRAIEDVIAEHLERVLDPGASPVAPRLAAASIVSSVAAIERIVGELTSAGGARLGGEKLGELVGVTMAYVEAGLAAVQSG